MKFLKIILIVTLLLILCVPLTYGDGTITSGETYITFKQEEPNTLNEWFYDLDLSEKIEIYNYWKEANHD